MTRFDFMADIATNESQARTNKEAIIFHCFNSQGLVARKNANDQRISDIVGAGLAPSGFIIAYGSFHSTWVDDMMALVNKKRIGTIERKVAVELLEEDCANQEEQIHQAVGA